MDHDEVRVVLVPDLLDFLVMLLLITQKTFIAGRECSHVITVDVVTLLI